MKNIKQPVGAVIGALALVAATVIGVQSAHATGGDPETCVPSEARTEVIKHPEEFHYETVVVTPAVEAVPGQHYSLKGNSGIGKDEVPPTPEVNPDIWQANTAQEPHDNGNGGKNITWLGTPGSGLHYASKDSEGKRDWFYYRAPVEGQEEVTEEIKVVDKKAWTETIEHPAVTCEDDPTEEPTDTPTEDPSDEPSEDPTEDPTPTDPTDDPERTDPPADPEPTDDPEETPTGPSEPEDTQEPEGDTSSQSTKQRCLAGALVSETFEDGQRVSVSTENGHPRCAPEPGGQPIIEEGM